MKLPNWLVDCIIRLAKRRPYIHIVGRDGDVYMERYWLKKPGRFIKSGVRVHHILRPDEDPWRHNHPFNFYRRILRGWYWEENDRGWSVFYAGDSGRVDVREYHRIDQVSPGGVWTLFICGPRIQSWGFKVDGTHVHWKTYLASTDAAHQNPYAQVPEYE